MVELWGINIYIVWQTTVVPLSVCRAFLIRTCICVTSHVLLLLHRTIFCKKCLHKQFFLKMVEHWGINIYIVWKTTVLPLSVCRAFLVRTCICVTNHVLLVLQRTIFCKKCLHKQFFLKMAERWGINICAVEKRIIVLFSVCQVFFSIVFFILKTLFFLFSSEGWLGVAGGWSATPGHGWLTIGWSIHIHTYIHTYF